MQRAGLNKMLKLRKGPHSFSRSLQRAGWGSSLKGSESPIGSVGAGGGGAHRVQKTAKQRADCARPGILKGVDRTGFVEIRAKTGVINCHLLVSWWWLLRC